jgi:CHAT domain-containing protein
MVLFYRHLRRGEAKSDALRRAQMELIHSGTKADHPFRWAAFVVLGDWQ